MKCKANLRKLVYVIAIFILAAGALCLFSGCGEKDKDNKSSDVQTNKINGEVESVDEFTHIGVYIDVGKDDVGITDVKYKISGDVAIVSFRYNGVRVELRGSCKYSQYELAGIEDTSNGDLIATSVEGYRASLYTLNPGRIIFWSDDQINYSLYVYVTATDDVVKEILNHVTFENRYDQRDDVQKQIAGESVKFAEKIIKVFNDKDIESLEGMMYYPQELGSGHSVANTTELKNLVKDDLFTDILLKALNEKNAVDDMRKSDDGSEFIIGTNYKNVHFKLMEDGQFLITKINN